MAEIQLVRIERWPGIGTLLGDQVLVISLEAAANALVKSGFMGPWIKSKIMEHLREGGSFVNKSRVPTDDEPSVVDNGSTLYLKVRSEWRLATDAEVLDHANRAEYASITGKSISKRARATFYLLRYHDGPDLIELYDRLPPQAKVVLDILNEESVEKFSEAGISHLLAKKSERLRTKQDPAKIFAFYRKRLIDEGHLELVEEETDDTD